ncbi:unnamed protein product, partial [Gongylonema pulchrum]|uniref:Thyroglobulin type-1 domain-containing protein n=1 Tax=Gongylonema pulchrum TaxID=637853 RepID=A0A183E0L5_9BILA
VFYLKIIYSKTKQNHFFQRHKYAGAGCFEETDEHRAKTLSFFDPENIRTCSIRRSLFEIERRCRCSMRRAYTPNPGGYQFCNVEQYFNCVLPTLQLGKKKTFDQFQCIPLCDQIDYTAWQDMTLLPNNIFPSLIETVDEEDADDVIDDYDAENDASLLEFQRDEHFQCEENQLLDPQQAPFTASLCPQHKSVHSIKRSAQRAYEKQSRYQDDIQLRTKRLILKLRESTQKLIDNGWGWTDDTYRDVFERLNRSVSCFNQMPITHAEMFTATENPPTVTEEARIANLFRLIFPGEDISGAKRFETVAQLREATSDRFDEVVKEMQRLSNMVIKLSKIYDPGSYKSSLGVNLQRMDSILGLVTQYETGRLQRRAWAEKMQSRNMRHFFDQDFFEMGAMLYFGDLSQQNMKKFGAFAQDIVDCTFGDVKNESVELLNSFKKVMHEFQVKLMLDFFL